MTGEQRADLERLTAFVRETVLPRTCPHTTERRRVLEALGEAGGLCTARTVELSSRGVVFCTREAGHEGPVGKPPWSEGKPGGRHLANASVRDGSSAYSHPHAAV